MYFEHPITEEECGNCRSQDGTEKHVGSADYCKSCKMIYHPVYLKDGKRYYSDGLVTGYGWKYTEIK